MTVSYRVFAVWGDNGCFLLRQWGSWGACDPPCGGSNVPLERVEEEEPGWPYPAGRLCTSWTWRNNDGMGWNTRQNILC